ncbi:hypothetical protein [Sphingobacterium siyangense]|uniref:hypothetical protein n=1 Tax=Sphingobacterium siyangense TaxID=459529 RepID=UPI002FDD8662
MPEILFYGALFIGVIPIIILFVEKKQFSTIYGIAPFIWITAFATVYEFLGTIIFKINTNYWFQIYSILEFTGVYFYYYQLFKNKYEKSLKILSIVWIITYSISFLYWDSSNKATALAINSCSISVFVFYYSFCYFKCLIEYTERNLLNNPNFYFVVGFSIYYATTILLFLSSKFLFEMGEYNFWWVNIIATLFLRILLILGVWKIK